jgi:hypothetical protein
VDEPVRDGRCGSAVVKELAPFIERQVRGDDGGCALVALVEDLVEQVSAAGIEAQLAEFIDKQEVRRGPRRQAWRWRCDDGAQEATAPGSMRCKGTAPSRTCSKC